MTTNEPRPSELLPEGGESDFPPGPVEPDISELKPDTAPVQPGTATLDQPLPVDHATLGPGTPLGGGDDVPVELASMRFSTLITLYHGETGEAQAVLDGVAVAQALAPRQKNGKNYLLANGNPAWSLRPPTNIPRERLVGADLTCPLHKDAHTFPAYFDRGYSNCPTNHITTEVLLDDHIRRVHTRLYRQIEKDRQGALEDMRQQNTERQLNILERFARGETLAPTTEDPVLQEFMDGMETRLSALEEENKTLKAQAGSELCDTCGKYFKTKFALTGHQQTHQQSNPE